MDPGEILDLGLRVYQNIGLAMLKGVAVPAVFCFGAIAFILLFALPELTFTEHAGNTTAQIGEAIATLGVGIAVGGPLFLIGISYASGVVTFLVADYVDGRPVNESGAHASTRRLLLRLFWLHARQMLQAWSPMLLAFAGLAAGALLSEALPTGSMWPAVSALVSLGCFVAAIFVMPTILSRHALAAATVCLEEKRPGAAVSRSIELMRGQGWAPSGYFAIVQLFLVVLILVFLIWLGAQVSLGLFQSVTGFRGFNAWPMLSEIVEKALQLMPLFLAVWTIIPVWCTTTTLLYYERRIRLEGYDIFALAREVWRTDRQSRFEL
jgi:hypothetical protein